MSTTIHPSILLVHVVDKVMYAYIHLWISYSVVKVSDSSLWIIKIQMLHSTLLLSLNMSLIRSFSSIGQIIAHVSWHCPQANPDIQLSGFKVMIDSKQYGNPMHDGIKTVRIKVGSQNQAY